MNFVTQLPDALARAIVWVIYQSNVWSGLLAAQLVRWTGKSTRAVHPKHFLKSDWRTWYAPNLRKDDAALDVGCANGLHTLEAARRCRSVCGFDYNARHLAAAQEFARRDGLDNVWLAQASVEEPWPYASEQFDVVLYLDVLEHVYGRDHSLLEARRVLRPGGRLLLSVPKRDTEWKALRARYGIFAYSDPDHKVEYSRTEIEDELARNGFVVLSNGPIVIDTPWSGLIDLAGGLSLPLYRRLAQWKRDAVLRRPQESSGFRIVAQRVAP